LADHDTHANAGAEQDAQSGQASDQPVPTYFFARGESTPVRTPFHATRDASDRQNALLIMARRRRPLVARLRDREVKNLAPLWRRSLVESQMRKRPTRTDMVITALFLIALVALLVNYLPGCLGHR
jgi:hypothetical protein